MENTKVKTPTAQKVSLMKKSQFTTSFWYEEKWVMFNALTNKFILLEPMVYELYQAAVHENKLNDIPDYHEELFDVLVDNGLIVPVDKDEVQAVKDLRNRVDFNESNYHLTINPTMNCNFKCWYCYEGHIVGSKLDNSVLEKVKLFITNKTNAEQLKSFTLSWFGGEPLLYYKDNVRPVIEHAYERCKERDIKLNCNFTTNGFLINDKMIEDFIKFEIRGLQITLDGNREAHNLVRFVHKNRGSYDEILTNIFKLARNGIYVAARINYTKDKLHTVDDIYNDMVALEPEFRRSVKVDFQRVWQTEDTKESREKVLILMNKFSDAGFLVSSVISNVDYVRGSCYADKKNQATINYDGNVFKCTARDFDPKTREGVLGDNGEIEWNEKYYKRLDVKFKNKPCLSCRILPICNGGCSQQALEHSQEYCMYDYDEDRKSEIVKNRFLLMLNNINITE